MNNITLAVDHGARSGYSIFTNGKYTHSGIVELGDVKSLRKAYKEFNNIFAIYKPTNVVIEKVNVAGTKFGGENIVKLAQLQVVVILLAQQYGCFVQEVNPMQLKKYITGNGRAEKREVAEVVADFRGLNSNHICVPVHFKRKDGIKTYLADESDAIALGIYATKGLKAHLQ